jgi:hypothetical protein
VQIGIGHAGSAEGNVAQLSIGGGGAEIWNEGGGSEGGSGGGKKAAAAGGISSHEYLSLEFGVGEAKLLRVFRFPFSLFCIRISILPHNSSAGKSVA